MCGESDLLGEGVLGVAEKPVEVEPENGAFGLLAQILISDMDDGLRDVEGHVLVDEQIVVGADEGCFGY